MELWLNRFYITAFLMQVQNKNSLAQKVYSIKYNKEFFMNILRKSIYEYYIVERWKIQNIDKTKNLFMKSNEDEFEFDLMQLDMIISTIESKWVK